MLIQRASDIPSSEITEEKFYRNRREFLKNASLALGVTALGPAAAGSVLASPLQGGGSGKYDTDETRTPELDVTTYNNYYEFGVGYDLPAINSKNFKTSPWKVAVEGHVKNPKVWDLDDLLSGITMEDRVYRMRCVEGWSMVIPWHGFPLATLINRLEPTASARYVEMQTLLDPAQMPEQRRPILNWPYTEGLRMDEAMNELAFMATGVYGKPGPNQNGAPMRLVAPWKYGFKGVKAIAKIRFVEQQPTSAWMAQAPHEYGFYANVNPNVAHPRWSQATERRLGLGLVASLLGQSVRQTLMFNGYSDYVAHMYEGMDLRRNY